MESETGKKRALAFISILVLMVGGCMTLRNRQPSSQDLQDTSPADAFLIVHQIAVSPRCTNCHSKGETPMQIEGGNLQVHSMYIHRSFTGLGGNCTTCHQDHNLDAPHLPPGAPNWTMPSKMKGYDSSITPAQLCQMWTGPENQFEDGPQTGQQRTPQEMLDHVNTDPRVIWAFAPGPGREPASANGHDYFVAYFKIWVAGGAPCPSN
jgi:hypothetical protein